MKSPEQILQVAKDQLAWRVRLFWIVKDNKRGQQVEEQDYAWCFDFPWPRKPLVAGSVTPFRGL